MKKLVLILFILIPSYVFASDNSIEFVCPINIKKDEEFECTVNVNSDYLVSGIDYKYQVEDADVISFSKYESWQGENYNNNISLYTGDFKKDEFIVGKIKFKAKNDIENINYNIEYLEFSDDKFNSHVIIDNSLNNVKQVENNEDNKVNNTKSNYNYVMMILIVIGIISIFIFIIVASHIVFGRRN